MPNEPAARHESQGRRAAFSARAKLRNARPYAERFQSGFCVFPRWNAVGIGDGKAVVSEQGGERKLGAIRTLAVSGSGGD
jgi:hypothetical protein